MAPQPKVAGLLPRTESVADCEVLAVGPGAVVDPEVPPGAVPDDVHRRRSRRREQSGHGDEDGHGGEQLDRTRSHWVELCCGGCCSVTPWPARYMASWFVVRSLMEPPGCFG